MMNLYRKLRYALRRFHFRLEHWLDQRWPVMCWHCKRWFQKQDTTEAQETTGVWRVLCKDCHTDLFTPWKREGK